MRVPPVLQFLLDRVSFSRPARVGDTLIIEALPVNAGRTSMLVRASVMALSVGQTTKRLISKADFIFVAIDANGKPTRLLPNKKVKGHAEMKIKKIAQKKVKFFRHKTAPERQFRMNEFR